MKQVDLFRTYRTPSIRDLRRWQVEEWKNDHGIWTHLCRGGGDWLALSMPECVDFLKGYSLTAEQKTNPVELMAGYCRLLEEAGLLEEGHETEYQAVNVLVGRITRK